MILLLTSETWRWASEGRPYHYCRGIVSVPNSSLDTTTRTVPSSCLLPASNTCRKEEEDDDLADISSFSRGVPDRNRCHPTNMAVSAFLFSLLRCLRMGNGHWRNEAHSPFTARRIKPRLTRVFSLAEWGNIRQPAFTARFWMQDLLWLLSPILNPHRPICL